MPRRPNGVSPALTIEIGWKLFSVVLPGMATETRRTQNFPNICEQSDGLMKRSSIVSNETLIIFRTRFSRQNAVNIIRCDSGHITFKVLCEPLH